ncbi:signal peptidase I [Kitasatospora sp. NPDC057542]|uniref:signal peptidase I n=1 Tax=Streptomycetaceae TaxID=2062 RepID=UPI001CC8FF31|nr:signal peptidase I [Streptomyces sp. LS1784]
MPKRRARGLWVSLAVAVTGILCVALGASVVLTGGYSVHRMTGGTMRPELREGDRILSDRVAAADVRRGEVYLVDSPWMLDHLVVSRVAALGGDRIACANGQATLNGRPLDEPPARQAHTCYLDFDVTVPPGRAFLMGDQRESAIDSRVDTGDELQGTVDLATLTGHRVVWHSGPDTPGLPGKLTGAVVLGALGVLLALGGLIAALVTGGAARRRGDS